jgi:hypothetical protein
MLANRNAKKLERLLRRMIRRTLARAIIVHFPHRGDAAISAMRRAIAFLPAHHTRFVAPWEIAVAQRAKGLHPDDHLMREHAELLPDGEKQSDTFVRVPAIPYRARIKMLERVLKRSAKKVVGIFKLNLVINGTPILAGTFRPRIAVVVDEKGRVGCEQRRALAVHKPRHIRGVGRVAAHQTVRANLPQLAGRGGPFLL